MKKVKNFAIPFRAVSFVFLFVILIFQSGCTEKVSENKDDAATEVTELAAEEIIWHIKAIHPEGYTLDIKALDADGNIYDVKAIQDAGQRQLMDIKALVGGEKTPVKILLSDDQYAPVKAITEGGTIYDIKALTADGKKLDVKGVKRAGNIIDIKAINEAGEFYGVKAISPEGLLNDVKGVKTVEDRLEATINGVEVLAHVKALPQMGTLTVSAIWHIKAIHPDGKTIDVKALDADGNIYDVKAIQDADQRQLMDIKALVGEKKTPVKILLSDDPYAPVKAITEEGAIYDIKALTEDGKKLDVKGVNRDGNIIDIKAINEAGEFYGVKAISPEGELNDVKGVKMVEDRLESTVNGVEVHAHVKALPQSN
ncbi:MAG: hypothetical protein KJN96_10165 [Eudoraea sp.]|nr:hypothetical protein [Eudoraea sp.]MBT8223519.1 hypothetical protein [Eudoraea sp.]NNK31322.1 hypothetical protein [Flavobacteriaceae bacterium]